MDHVTASPLRVLVVEDDPLQLRSFLRCLTARGHETASACCVADALGKLGRERYDVALLDLELPDGTGLEIAAGCALGARCGSCGAALDVGRIVFLTGSCNDELLRLASGFGAVLRKPAPLWDLVAEVEAL